MKVTLKLMAATILGILAVFLIFGVIRAQREMALFDSDMRKDHDLIGATLGLCVSKTWDTEGESRALRLIEEADKHRPDLRIGWIFNNGRRVFRTPMIAPAAFTRGGTITHFVQADPQAPSHSYLVTLVPVQSQESFLGSIEIAESLSTRDNYLRTNARNVLLATLLMVLTSGVVVLLLGVWMVGRPLQQLADKARRIGQGDLTGTVAVGQRDEIGQLAREFNAMCDRIVEANARTEAETSARIRAMDQLRHADRLITVGRLAAGIAHELGTPLNVIGGRAKMLSKGNLDSEATRAYLHEIQSQTDGMARIIRQLLDFARRREPKVMTVELVSLAQTITSLVAPLAAKKDVRISVLSTEPVLARGDAMQLEQVMSNLVVNAIHACDRRGHVDITCGVVGDSSAGGQAYFRVTDDGHGMAPEVIEHIFEPFFTTKDIGQGTGLGLSVAHGIVEDHGGTIRVDSAPSRGSTFTVYISKAQL